MNGNSLAQNTSPEAGIPAGFTLYPPISAYVSSLGPLHERWDGQTLALGMHLQAGQTNHHQVMHGGAIATLADNAMGGLAQRLAGGGVATVNMSLDFLAPVALGEWVEVVATADKVGGQMMFLRCEAKSAGRIAFRAQATFVRRRSAEQDGAPP